MKHGQQVIHDFWGMLKTKVCQDMHYSGGHDKSITNPSPWGITNSVFFECSRQQLRNKNLVEMRTAGKKIVF